MPFYEYLRSDGVKVEIFKGFFDMDRDTCPETGLPVKRVYSVPSGRVSANFSDGSPSNNGISQAYYDSVRKRKYKKSEETIEEERVS